MSYYTLNGGLPQYLPERIRMPDRSTRTTPISHEDYIEAGYIQVPDPPEFDSTTQKLDWHSGRWWVIDLEPNNQE